MCVSVNSFETSSVMVPWWSVFSSSVVCASVCVCVHMCMCVRVCVCVSPTPVVAVATASDMNKPEPRDCTK